MKNLIQEIIDKNIKIFEKEKHIKMEDALNFISTKYNFETVDAYGSLMGTLPGEGKFFIPNSYGQEDSWDYDALEFDFVILKNKEVIIVKYKDEKTSINHVFFDVKIDFDSFGGKRGYYLHKDLVRFRTTPEFYKTLKPENRYPDGEKDLSGPHFTIRF